MVHKLLPKPKAFAARWQRMIWSYAICWLLVAAVPASAQRVSMSDLLTYMCLPADKFDACMFQKGFVCFKSTGGLNGWTCLFAYNGNSLMLRPSDAMALMQYSRNSRSDLLMYQVRSKDEYESLQKQLVHLGYTLEPVASDRITYILANTVVTFQKTDSANGIASNYEGYQVALAHRRY